MDYLETQASTKPTRRESLKIPDSQSTAPEQSKVIGNLILDTFVSAFFFEEKHLFRLKNTTCMNPAKVPHITVHTDNLQVPL